MTTTKRSDEVYVDERSAFAVLRVRQRRGQDRSSPSGQRQRQPLLRGVSVLWLCCVLLACSAAQRSGVATPPAPIVPTEPTPVATTHATPQAADDPTPQPPIASVPPESSPAPPEPVPGATPPKPIDPKACRALDDRGQFHLKELRAVLTAPPRGSKEEICNALVGPYFKARGYYDKSPTTRLEVGGALARVYEIRRSRGCLEACGPQSPCPEDLTAPDHAWRAHERILKLLESTGPGECPRRPALEQAATDYFVVLAKRLEPDDDRLVKLLDNLVLLRPDKAMRELIALVGSGHVSTARLKELVDSLDAKNSDLLAPLAKKLAQAAQQGNARAVATDALLDLASALGALATKRLEGKQLGQLTQLLRGISSNDDLRRLLQLGDLYDMTFDAERLKVVNAAVDTMLVAYPNLQAKYERKGKPAEDVRNFLSLLDQAEIALLDQHARDIGAWVVVDPKLRRESVLFRSSLPCDGSATGEASPECITSELFRLEFLNAFNPRALQHLQPVEGGALAPQAFLDQAQKTLEQSRRCTEHDQHDPLCSLVYTGALVVELSTEGGAGLRPKASWVLGPRSPSLDKDKQRSFSGEALSPALKDDGRITAAAISFAVEVVKRMAIGKGTSPEAFCPDVAPLSTATPITENGAPTDRASAPAVEQTATTEPEEATDTASTPITDTSATDTSATDPRQPSRDAPSAALAFLNAGYPYLIDDADTNDGCGRAYAWTDTGLTVLALGSTLAAVFLGANTTSSGDATAANAFWTVGVSSAVLTLGTKIWAWGRYPKCF